MSFFKPYYYLILTLVLVAGCRQQEIQYTDFFGSLQTLNYLESKEIRLFYSEKNFKKKDLKKLLLSYDTAYIFAVRISGQHPRVDSRYGEKLPVAVVRSTCGSGCGKLGMKGIEFTEEKFKSVVQLFLDSNKHDHIFFYELGRNFWFYESSLTLKEHPENVHIRTGFAIFLRNVLIYELGIKVGSINGVPYSKYMENNSETWKEFKKNAGPNPLNTLLVGEKAEESKKAVLWSRYWWDLYEFEGHSSKFLEVYFQELKKKLAPESIDDLILNLTVSYENAKIRY